MIRTFADLEKYILDKGIKKTLALAGSHDSDALAAAVAAKKKGVVSATLIGNEIKTREMLRDLGEPEVDYHIIDEPDGKKAAHMACKMVMDGKADMPMKGKLVTSDFMRAVLDKQYGFIPEDGLLCQATVFEFALENRLAILSDCAINIAPDYAAKKKILENAVELAHRLGMELPRVAVIAPVEVVNPVMQSTIDAAMLAKACERGQISGCLVDGPLALDNAINLEAAKAKGIGGEVAGRADILIMPDLCTGNALTKSLHYFANLNQSGNITGAAIPIVMTSRTDTPQNKYNSILVAIFQSL